MDDWLAAARDQLAAAAGVPPEELELAAGDETELLDLARIAAHESAARTNAPLLCYLVGRAAGRSGADLDTLARALRHRTEPPSPG